MNTFYVKHEYTAEQGPSHDEGDGSEWSGFEHTVYTNHSFTVSETKPDYPDQTFNTSLDKGYIIAVIYGDGGTFGRTDGFVQYFGVFCKEKAIEIIELINKVQYEPKYDKAKEKVFEENIKKLKSILSMTKEDYIYFNWLGYFGSFEGMYLLCTDDTYKEIA